MGLEVIQADTSFRVPKEKAAEFERVFLERSLDNYWTLRKDPEGNIEGIDLVGHPGRPCEPSDLEALLPFVDKGSFITLETAWGDDAWRWTFHGNRLTERTFDASDRAF